MIYDVKSRWFRALLVKSGNGGATSVLVPTSQPSSTKHVAPNSVTATSA
jgi:hypothetical protein